MSADMHIVRTCNYSRLIIGQVVLHGRWPSVRSMWALGPASQVRAGDSHRLRL